jgi:hypothetical protein
VCPREGDGERECEGEEECRRLRRPRDGELCVVVVFAVEDFCSDGTLAKDADDEAVVFLRRSSSPQWEIRTGSLGRSLSSTGTLAMRSKTTCPETTCPNTVCLPLRCELSSKVMKNLES